MRISELLNKLKCDIESKEYDFVPTQKNRDSRRKYGLSVYDIEDFLLEINESNLYKGPVSDYDFPDEDVYIFKREIKEGLVFYVKIKEKDGKIKILSCHEDESN
ncbi:MAG: type II toxin-antitoxin system MqsR family toxin [Clostridia bacterium]|nr:type II toxin-antitoxin system MqsR family toxin [Clostridia bacterium]